MPPHRPRGCMARIEHPGLPAVGQEGPHGQHFTSLVPDRLRPQHVRGRPGSHPAGGNPRQRYGRPHVRLLRPSCQIEVKIPGVNNQRTEEPKNQNSRGRTSAAPFGSLVLWFFGFPSPVPRQSACTSARDVSSTAKGPRPARPGRRPVCCGWAGIRRGGSQAADRAAATESPFLTGVIWPYRSHCQSFVRQFARPKCSPACTLRLAETSVTREG